MTNYHPDAIDLHPSEQRWCKHCKVIYPATAEYFYLSRGKVHGNCRVCAIQRAGERQRREAARRNGLKSKHVKEAEQRTHDNRLKRIMHKGPTRGTLEHVVFCRWQPTDVDRESRYQSEKG